MSEIEIVRAADEGVPIGALARIFGTAHTSPDIRTLLREAVASGRLVAMPSEDWPPLAPRDQRVPTGPLHALGADDHDVLMQMAQNLHTTKLESRVLMVILRRGRAHRDQLHDAVEANRGNPDDETQQKIVDVVICKLRKKLTPLGLTLRTVHSFGYEMSETDRARAWALIRGEVPCGKS